MKASNSEAFNRVVNKRLFSKQMIVAIVFAFVMVSSAFVIVASSWADNVTPSLEGWRRLPAQEWAKGDIRGYKEGEFIPVDLTLNKPSGSNVIGARLGFEWGKDPGTTNEIRGFDSVCLYPPEWIDTPTGQALNPPLSPPGPFRPAQYPGVGESLFYAEPDPTPTSKGSLTEVRVTDSGKDYYTEDQRLWIAWDLVFTFSGSFSTVDIFAGGLLYETTSSTMGASYYHGSSLHMRILGTIDEKGVYHPCGGSQDLPINVLEIQTPPTIMMLKTFDPDVRAPNEMTTITIEIQNHGQADAYLLDLWDYLPDELEYVGLLETWTSRDSTHVRLYTYDPIEDPADPTTLHFDFRPTVSPADPNPLSPFSLLYGTGHDGGIWVRYFSFVVRVMADATPGTVTNIAEIYFSDSLQNPPYPGVRAHDDLTIIEVLVSIEKVATTPDSDPARDPSTWTEIDCAAIDYDVDGNVYIDPDSGDTVRYMITVKNEGTVDIVKFDVFDAKLGGSGTIAIWSMPDATSPPGWKLAPGASITKAFDHTFTGENDDVWVNTATVKAYDANNRQAVDVDSASVDLLYPDVSITKVADKDIAAWIVDEVHPDGWGEVITYTITVTNLDSETHVDFTVTDPMAYDGLPGGLDWSGTLEPKGDPLGHDIATRTLTYTVKEDSPATIDNTATLTGTAYCLDDTGAPCWGEYPLTRTASESVKKVLPRIDITKTPVDAGGNIITGVDTSGVVRYRIDVDNTGDVGLSWFYWDDFAETSWTPLTSGVLDYQGYVIQIGGCWAVEKGEYSVDTHEPTHALTYGITTHNTFEGSDLIYEVKMDSTGEPNWRGALAFRYSESSSGISCYVVGLWYYGWFVFEITDSELVVVSQYYTTPVSPGLHTLKAKVYDSSSVTHIAVSVDGGSWTSAYTDYSPQTGEKIGLWAWDEAYGTHVHFDNVIVRDITDPSKILLEDHFASLVPEDPTLPVPEILFDPAVPDELECPYYCARLASGYMEPDDPIDTRYYTYEVQDDDPNPLVNTVTAYGWHNPDAPEYYVQDHAGASVIRFGAMWGIAFDDVHKDLSSTTFPYGMYNGVRDMDSGGHYYSEEYGMTRTWIIVTLWEWDGTSYDADGNPINKDFYGSMITQDDSTYGPGYYRFGSLNPGWYVVDVSLVTPGEGAKWFVTKYQWWTENLVAGEEAEHNFGLAEFGWIESYKWLDWNPNDVVECGALGEEEGLDGKEIRVRGVDYAGNLYPGPDADDYATTLTGPWTGPGSPSPAIMHGWYKFTLKPGIYEVWEELPTGWGTTKLILQPGQDPSDPNSYKPHYHNIIVSDGAGDGSAKFGNYPLIKIWGIKFFDKDCDGIQDWTDSEQGPMHNGVWDPGEETEPGLNGWIVKLWRKDLQTDTYYAYPDVAHQMQYTTATVGGKNGYYEFADLPPGMYKVTEVIDTNIWKMTTTPSSLQGIGPPFPTDPNGHHDAQYAAPLTLDPVKIGNLRYARIEGWKFMDSFGVGDAWPDGSFARANPNEYGLQTQTITLEGKTAWGTRIVTSDVTGDGLPDPSGWYSFADVLPGTYWVNATQYVDLIPTNSSSDFITIPAYPLGPQIVMKVSFGVVIVGIDPEWPFALKKGWNMWSTPVHVAGLKANALLLKIGSHATAIAWYDTTQKKLVPYVKNAPVGDFDIVVGKGYQILTNADCSFTLRGDLLDSVQVSLAKGWNLVGYTALKPMKASELLSKVTGCKGMAITYTDKMTKATWMYVSGAPAGDFTVGPGHSYNLLTNGPGLLTFG